MFTGIVEEVGRVAERRGARLRVEARAILADGCELGQSVAVNGVCLTVVERGPGALAFDLGPETLRTTALGDLGAGDPVNLERPLRLGGFVGGHLVQGHVDGVGVVTRVDREAETARVAIQWQPPGEGRPPGPGPEPGLAGLLIPKGSVAVDGVSLTVAQLGRDAFEVMLIPHTLTHSTLGQARPGRRVNLEMDMIGKYVTRALALRGEDGR